MSFLEGYIESLSEIGIEEGSVDLIISNCVVNLSVNKEAVLKQLHRALAFGGEFQFSDVFSDQVLPQAVRTHKVLVGECLGGMRSALLMSLERLLVLIERLLIFSSLSP